MPRCRLRRSLSGETSCTLLRLARRRFTVQAWRCFALLFLSYVSAFTLYCYFTDLVVSGEFSPTVQRHVGISQHSAFDHQCSALLCSCIYNRRMLCTTCACTDFFWMLQNKQILHQSENGVGKVKQKHAKTARHKLLERSHSHSYKTQEGCAGYVGYDMTKFEKNLLITWYLYQLLFCTGETHSPLWSFSLPQLFHSIQAKTGVLIEFPSSSDLVFVNKLPWS